MKAKKPKVPKAPKTPKSKLKLKEQLAIACFMEGLPRLLEMWRKSEDYPILTFDEYLLRAYEFNKSPPKKNEERRNE